MTEAERVEARRKAMTGWLLSSPFVARPVEERIAALEAMCVDYSVGHPALRELDAAELAAARAQWRAPAKPRWRKILEEPMGAKEAIVAGLTMLYGYVVGRTSHPRT